MLIDTHAHIHFDEYSDDIELVFDNSKKNGVNKIITIGTDDLDSKKALDFCLSNNPKGLELFASAGLHPHEADNADDKLLTIRDLVLSGEYDNQLIAIGECGLDYYKNYSQKHSQYKALEFQIEIALAKNIPLVFHVRDAWDDFFAVIQNYKGIRGVIHSFTGRQDELEKAQELGLYFGINGIVTFSKDSNQLEAVKNIKKDYLLLETDCPFLTPNPFRGKKNEPANIKIIAEFIAQLRGETLTELSAQTTTNAKTLFGLK